MLFIIIVITIIIYYYNPILIGIFYIISFYFTHLYWFLNTCHHTHLDVLLQSRDHLVDVVMPKPAASDSDYSFCPPTISTTTSLSSFGAEKFDEKVAILSWLNFVDTNIIESSVDILKLGLFKEISYGKIEKLNTASSLYQVLKSQLGRRRGLGRFLYALRCLGRRRHGIHCTEQFDNQVKLPYNPHPAETSEDQMLYQCLVEMCIELDSQREVFLSLRKYVCRHIIGINWRHPKVQNPALLFLLMLVEGHISVENRDTLAKSLDQVRAQSCLVILRNYGNEYGWPEIDVDKEFEDMCKLSVCDMQHVLIAIIMIEL